MHQNHLGAFKKHKMPQPQSRPIKLKCPGGDAYVCLFLKSSIDNSNAEPSEKPLD